MSIRASLIGLQTGFGSDFCGATILNNLAGEADWSCFFGVKRKPKPRGFFKTAPTPTVLCTAVDYKSNYLPCAFSD